MREGYKKILDEMVINKDVINECTDGTKILMYLLKNDVLSYQENFELTQMGPTNSIEHLMKISLKPKNDEAMIHFLDSLDVAKFHDAYSWLKGKLDNPDSTFSWKTYKIDNTLKTIWDNLKIHYKERLEFVESYWRQFGVKGILDMDTFYNHNIVISNEKDKQIQKKIENFNDMFSTGYKRIIVMAEAGYGKSTFVHEMARQWVKGDKDWTRKFQFLFLFRLTEVNENESKSLENLLTLCLYPQDASKVCDWLLKDGNMSKALFIFDGLDELRQEEVNEIIFGGKVNLETVIITSRQCDKLEGIKKDTHRKLYIELKGYTNEGVIQQLKKFFIPIHGMKNDLKNHLKIPLFNTIFCITHSESSLGCTSVCSSIISFVHFAINRYRNSNPSFTVSCKEQLLLTLRQAAWNIFSFAMNHYQISNHSFTVSCKKQLLLTLGQAAQNKFSFIQGVEVPYPNVSSDHLFWAVNSGLLHNSSLIEELVFAHHTIAEYCAAYFWSKTRRLTIKHCYGQTVLLKEPPKAKMKYLESFSQFLCYLYPEFKGVLWKKFAEDIPIFNEYINLPVREDAKTMLSFSSHSVDDQFTIMNKLRFQENDELTLRKAWFEPEKLFTAIRKLKKLYLLSCTFNIGGEAFFTHFTNVQSLRFILCHFYNLNIAYDNSDSHESNLPCPPHLSLQKLKIENCLGIETFLRFIMKHSVFMKSFKLKIDTFYDVSDRRIGWISELQSNKRLCVSIESCKLEFAYPSILIPFIETIKIMQNIKQLYLHFWLKLTKLQANSLADLLQVGLFGLNDINLNIEMENKEDYEPILKNLSKLSALTSLCLMNRPFTTDTLKYLIDIFNKLKLEQCELDYQEIFFEERIINSINSCISLKKVTFYRKKMDNDKEDEEGDYVNYSNYESFKKGIENKDRQVIIQDESDYSSDSDE